MSDSEDEVKGSNTLPKYNGKGGNDWMMFKIQVTAYGNQKGWGAALDSKIESKLPGKESDVLDLTKTDDAKKNKAKKQNEKAMYALSLAFGKKPKLMNLLLKSKTKDWPTGKAYKVMEMLQKKHAPIDDFASMDKEKDLENLKYKKNDDPANFFGDLGMIQHKYRNEDTGYEIPEKELLTTAYKKLNKYYPSTMTSIRMNNKGSLTVDKLEEELCEYWRLNNNKSEPVQISNDDDNNDVALSSVGRNNNRNNNNNNNHDHNCGYCDGNHPTKGCREKKRHANTKCHLCGMTGHIKKYCWHNEANAHKRPRNWKSRKFNGNNTNTGNTAVSDGGNSNDIEVILTSIGKQTGKSAVNNMPIELMMELAAGDINDDDSIDDDEFLEEIIDYVDDPVIMRRRIEKNDVIECYNDNPDDVVDENGDLVEWFDKYVDKDLESALNAVEIPFPKAFEMLKHKNMWIADTGASTHSTPHKEGFVNIQKLNNKTLDTQSGELETSMKGDIPGVVCDPLGKEKLSATITGAKLTKGAKFNLFSLSKMQRDGWLLFGNKEAIWITKGNTRLDFDIRIETEEGYIYALYHKRTNKVTNESSVAVIGRNKSKMTLKEAHGKFGHHDIETTKKIAKALGIVVADSKKMICESCAVGKAKQKNLPSNKEDDKDKDKLNRMYLDICSYKKDHKDDPNIPKKNMCMKVIEKTGLKLAHFYDTKNGMIEPTCELLKRFEQQGMKIDVIRCDNAGENKSLQNRTNSSDWKLNIAFEFTARDTPQQNHLAEIGITVVNNRGRALLHAANIPKKYRNIVAAKAIETAAKLDGLRITNINGREATRYIHQYGVNPPFANYLRTWGEAGVVKTKTRTTPKQNVKGVTCMFVGYATDHEGDCYEMWNPPTRRLLTSRDITWLNRMYFQKDKPDDDIVEIDDSDDDTVESESTMEDNDDDPDAEAPPQLEGGVEEAKEEDSDDDDNESEEEEEEQPKTTRYGRLRRKRMMMDPSNPKTVVDKRALEALNRHKARAAAADNPDLNAVLQELQSQGEKLTAIQNELGLAAVNDVGLVGAGIGGGYSNTQELHVMKYNEAMATKDKDYWAKAVDEEYQRMMKYDVFTVIKHTDLPKDAKVLTTTWAMKKKPNGTFRARLVARGFEQENKIHYQDNDIAAPVVNDVTIKLAFVLQLLMGGYSQLVDVKGAFLTGNFEDGEILYMEVPQGFEKHYPEGTVLLLNKTIYGLKQAAKQYWKEAVRCFISMGYKQSKADPCLYYKWVKEGIMIWLSWVDDFHAIGPNKRIVMAEKQALFERFECDDVGDVVEYVGNKIDWINGGIRFTQPVLLDSFKDEFDLDTVKEKPVTPFPAGTVLVDGNGEGLIDKQGQSKYRTGVGKLLHIMRWSRPDIYNAGRELSRFGGKATVMHMKMMLRVMKYCVETKNRGLFFKIARTLQNMNIRDCEIVIVGNSDSDYAKNPDDRKSVISSTVLVENCAVVNRCRSMKVTALSVTEAETDAAVNTAQDMMFIMRILESIGLKVKLPMTLNIDNKGTVDLLNNWSVGGRTRHIETRQYFIRDLKAEGIMEIKWIPSGENVADINTKHLSGPEFNKHVVALVGEDEYM